MTHQRMKGLCRFNGNCCCCFLLLIINAFDLHVGIEARGFMFGPSIALGIGAKFVPLRKPRKLPGIFVFFPIFNKRLCPDLGQSWNLTNLVKSETWKYQTVTPKQQNIETTFWVCVSSGSYIAWSIFLSFNRTDQYFCLSWE